VGDVRYEIRPLGAWDRPATESRKSAGTFRIGWFDALEELRTEVAALGGSLVVVRIDAADADIRRDGMLRSRAKVGFPGVKLSFESKHGPLTYATDVYEKLYSGDLESWQANVRAITLGLRALRAVDRYGITRTGEQYRGWTQIGAKAAEDGMTTDEAVRVIADAGRFRPEFVRVFADALVSAGAGRERIVGRVSVADSRTALAKICRKAMASTHPDAGGNADVFRLVVKARDVLLEGR
jgi:hypothetical protein